MTAERIPQIGVGCDFNSACLCMLYQHGDVYCLHQSLAYKGGKYLRNVFKLLLDYTV
jgi:hypothetical protein